MFDKRHFRYAGRNDMNQPRRMSRTLYYRYSIEIDLWLVRLIEEFLHLPFYHPTF